MKECTVTKLSRNQLTQLTATAAIISSTGSTGDHIWYVDLTSSDASQDMSKLLILIYDQEESSHGEAARVLTIYDGTTTTTELGTSTAREGMSEVGQGNLSTTLAIESATNDSFLAGLNVIGPLESARFMDSNGKLYFEVDSATKSSALDYNIAVIQLP